MKKCWVEKHPEYGGCCCKCKFRLRAFAQQTSDRIPDTWLCVAFAFCEGEAIGYVGDFGHGMCELYAGITPVEGAI